MNLKCIFKHDWAIHKTTQVFITRTWSYDVHDATCRRCGKIKYDATEEKEYQSKRRSKAIMKLNKQTEQDAILREEYERTMNFRGK